MLSRATIALVIALTFGGTCSGCATIVTHGWMGEKGKAARGIPDNFAGSYVDVTFSWGAWYPARGSPRNSGSSFGASTSRRAATALNSESPAL